MKNKIISLGLIALGLGFGAAQAEQNSAVSLKVGTTGFGVAYQYQINDQFVAGIDYNTLTNDQNIEADGIDYNSDLKFNVLTASAKWHPLKNGWYGTLGLGTGERDIALSAKVSSNTTIGNNTYTPAQIGTLTSKVSFPKSNTLIGFGYDNAFYTDSMFRYGLLFGVQMSSSPKVAISSDGLLSTNPSYLNDVNIEAENLAEDLKEFKVYPVLQAKISYRF